MNRVLLALAATALLAACVDSPTAPNVASPTLDVALQAGGGGDDIVIQCDPETEPGCVPPPPFEPRIPVKACLNIARSGAPAEVLSKLCGPGFPRPGVTGQDIVIQCDPNVDPGCDPGAIPPMIPLKACANILASGAPLAVFEKLCGAGPRPKPVTAGPPGD